MLSILSRHCSFVLLGCSLLLLSCGGGSEDGNNNNFPELPTTNDLQEIQVEDAEIVVDPDIQTDTDAPPGPVELSFYAPTTCGCAPSEIPPVNCGWFSGMETVLNIRARHTYGAFEGAEGINRVRVYWIENVAQGEELAIAIATTPESSGFFQVEWNAGDFLPKDSETDEIIEGTYFFRIEAISKIKDDNGEAMSANDSFALTYDFSGPTVSMISPNPNLDVNPKFIETFPAVLLAKDSGSGLRSARFFFADDEIEPSLTGLGGTTEQLPLGKNLDIIEFPTQTGDFRVEVSDCLGNVTVETVEVDFIGTPKFDLPPRLSSEEETDTPQTIHVVDINPDDGLDDILAIGDSTITLHRTTDGGVGSGKLLLQLSGLLDAQMVDFDRDGFQDIIAIVELADEKRLMLFPQQIEEEEGDSPLFLAEPDESRKLDTRVTFFRIHDMNKDEFPDVILASPDDDYSAAVLLHSQRTWQDEGPGKTYMAPSSLAGVTGITDLAFGNLNGDGYPDALAGRKDSGYLTALINNLDGGFEIAQDTQVFGAGTALVELGDLNADGFDDAVHSAISQNAIYVSQSTGIGYFSALKAFVGQTVEDFGAQHVAGVVDYDLLSPGARESGEILSLGNQPDSMILANLDDYSELDIAVAVPGDNRVAVFLAEPPTQPGAGGKFSDTYFTQPGLSPHSLVVGRFNSDPYNDLGCIAGEPPEVVVLMNRGGTNPGTFVGPQELPMPVKRDWTAGRLEPQHFVVRDIDNIPGTEVVVVTESAKQMSPNGDSSNVPLIVSYVSMGGGLPQLPPIKSPTNPELTGNITGLGAGYLDDVDLCVDLAVSYERSTKTPCQGRTFDILRGCKRVVDSYEEAEELGGQNADYFKPTYSQQRGHFWALGGYLGLEKPTGIAVANLDTDDLDDIILLAPQSGNPEQPDSYQPDEAAAYLTRFDKQWLLAPGGETSCPQYYEQTWFRCAPYWPIQQVSQYVCNAAGDEPPPCIPAAGDSVCQVELSRAQPADSTTTEEVGNDPVGVVVGDFYPDGMGCLDMMVAWKSGNVTYLRSSCSLGYYNVHQPDKPPHLFAVGANPVDIKAADLDQDGYVDAVAALEDNLSVVYGVPGGELFQAPIFLIDSTQDGALKPSSLSLSDVNEDGLLDIMFTIKNTGQLGIYVSGGDRTFFGPFSLPTGATPIDSAVADMDGDGCLDVAVLNRGSKSVTILKNQRCGN